MSTRQATPRQRSAPAQGGPVAEEKLREANAAIARLVRS